MFKPLRVTVAAIMILGATSCFAPEDNPVNKAPTAAPFASNNTLFSAASDAENDNLQFTWTLASTGALLGNDRNLDITQWTQLYQGYHFVTLNISDGHNSVSYPPIYVDFGTSTNIVDIKPTASFAVSALSGDVPFNVDLDASLSTDDIGIKNYTWFIEDQQLTGVNSSYTFENIGNFEIKLVVMDSNNQTAEIIKTIWATQADTDLPPIARYRLSNEMPVISNGSPIDVEFDASISSDDVEVINYLWVIDGVERTDATTTFQFSQKGIYNISLTVTDSADQTHTTTGWIEVTEQNEVMIPVDFTTNSTTLNITQTLSLNVTNPDNNLSYEWDINGKTQSGLSATHQFSSTGTFNVTLKATNANDESNSKTIVVTVISNQPVPKISIASNSNLSISLIIDFESSATAYRWSVDKKIENGSTLNYTFDQPGTYPVSLSADYGNGFIEQDRIEITVSVEDLPMCTFTVNNDPYCQSDKSSDSDNDGWGFENSTACVFANGPIDPAPGSCELPRDSNFGDDYKDLGNGLSGLAPFPIGLAVPDGTGTSGVSILNNTARQNILKADFSQITIENKMKMSYLENGFSQADAIVNWAIDNGLGVNGHALVWHHPSQLPSWAKNPGNDFKEKYIAQITQTAEHFADRVYSWDVVNEALYDLYDQSGHTNNDGLRNSVYFNQYNGSSYIHEAFRAARAAAPNAILYYNDFNTEENQGKTTALVNLVKELLDNNVPIDGVGFQMHVVNSYPSIANIRAAMKKIVDLDPKLMIKITELDVRINNVYDNDESNDFVNRSDCNVSCTGLDVQKQKYKDIINAYLEVVPAHRRGGISVWGVADLDSWLYENNGDRKLPDWPLLFNDNFEKKPAFFGVQEAIQSINN